MSVVFGTVHIMVSSGLYRILRTALDSLFMHSKCHKIVYIGIGYARYKNN